MATSIALTSGKGGVGKSTAARQFSSIIEDALLIAHDSTANFSFINKFRTKIAEQKKITPVQASIFESFERKKKDDGSIEIINNFETYYNFINNNNANAIYDLGGYDSIDHRVIYSIVDHILIPTGLAEIDLQNLETMDDTLKETSKKVTDTKIKSLKKKLNRELTQDELEQANTKLIGKVFACRIHPSTTKSGKRFLNLIKKVAQYEHLELLDSVIYERADYVKASNIGFSILELPQTKHSKAAREIKALANEINITP